MKVLHINSYFERNFYELLFTALRNSGVDFDVVVPCAYQDKRYDYLKNKYQVLECYKKIDRVFLKSKIDKIVNAILKNNDLSNYDLIHAHSLVSNGCPSYEIYKKIGTPYITAVRGSDVYFLNKFFFYHKKYFEKVILNAQKIIFISPSLRNALLRWFKSKKIKEKINKDGIVIPNGINPLFFESAPKENKFIDIDIKDLKILSVGNIIKEKNHIYIASSVKANKIKCRLDIAGNKINENIVKKLQLYPFVNLLGKKDISSLPDIYKEHDVFALISLNETFGLVYIEAMSQGLPLLYTKGCGIDGFFKEGEVGYAVDPHCKKDFADKLNLLLNNYDEISSRCITKAKEFNWVYIANEYKNIYIECYKKHE